MKEDNDSIEQLKALLNKTEQQYDTVCNIRLLTAVIGFLFLVLSLIHHEIIYLCIFILVCFFFILFLFKYDKVKDKILFLKGKLQVLERRINRRNHLWSTFPDKGEKFLTEDADVQRDLDIFGANSLYQYLCVANTKFGKEQLAAYLSETNPDFSLLKARQEAIGELLYKKDLSLSLEIYSNIIGNAGNMQADWYDNYINYLGQKNKLISGSMHLLSLLLPAMTILSSVLSAAQKADIFVIFILFTLQLFIASFISYKNQNVLQKVFAFCGHIGTYHKLLEVIENADFTSKYLKELQSKLLSGQKATRGIAKLYSLNEFFQVRHNTFAHLFLQGFLMYDMHCLYMLEKWKNKYSNSIPQWFYVIGEIEALLSLSMIGLDRKVTFPEFLEEKQPVLLAENIAHPLIHANKTVPNSIYLQSEVAIITGSNMSGKTTFLRTLGINVILAYAGAPVIARNFKLSNMKLFTSMRVTDDVAKGISTFYAEVKRIKEMADYAKTGLPMLALIDEIFKGTNSADRIIGAKEIIKRLHTPQIILLVTTHDMELCDLVMDKNVKGCNYHFQEFYKENQLFFDYKLKDGKCQTTNAKYILKMAGLL